MGQDKDGFVDEINEGHIHSLIEAESFENLI